MREAGTIVVVRARAEPEPASLAPAHATGLKRARSAFANTADE